MATRGSYVHYIIPYNNKYEFAFVISYYIFGFFEVCIYSYFLSFILIFVSQRSFPFWKWMCERADQMWSCRKSKVFCWNLPCQEKLIFKTLLPAFQGYSVNIFGYIRYYKIHTHLNTSMSKWNKKKSFLWLESERKT